MNLQTNIKKRHCLSVPVLPAAAATAFLIALGFSTSGSSSWSSEADSSVVCAAGFLPFLALLPNRNLTLEAFGCLHNMYCIILILVNVQSKIITQNRKYSLKYKRL